MGSSVQLQSELNGQVFISIKLKLNLDRIRDKEVLTALSYLKEKIIKSNKSFQNFIRFFLWLRFHNLKHLSTKIVD